MSERWARTALSAYRLAGSAIYPFVGGYVRWRAKRGKEDPARRRERYGHTRIERPDGPLIWVHAASVGETVAVTPLINRLAGMDINIVLTTGTVTSARVADERLGDLVIHQYVPLDLKPAVSRFLDHWRPDLAIMAESEIWPMTILGLGSRRIPQILVNGRLSDKSFASWFKRPHLASALFENLALVIAQSEEDGERFMRLGARPIAVSGNLKVDTAAPPVDTEELQDMRAQIGGRPTWAAVSTHDGEEDIAADVHARLASRHPGLLTIIVPRHPERGAAVAALLEARGLKVARRSRREEITLETDVFLGDTIGEMGLYLRLSEIVFVGRSLSANGGQNPLEPAMLGAAVLSGRNVENFRDSYDRLVKGGGARFVKDGDMLAGAVNFLLVNETQRKDMIASGKTTVESMRGALERTLQTLDPYIHPLSVKARLNGGG
jgi:3-deoxy-D-manno-octulosonic-acid transferase